MPVVSLGTLTDRKARAAYNTVRKFCRRTAEDIHENGACVNDMSRLCSARNRLVTASWNNPYEVEVFWADLGTAIMRASKLDEELTLYADLGLAALAEVLRGSP